MAPGTGGLGTDYVKWHGVQSGTRMVGLGTLLTSFGAVSDTLAGSPCGWNRIGDKPGRETCVVSQVVADTLAGLSLDGCRVHVM